MWTCNHPTCDRKVKGFPNGRTLCGVCQAIDTKTKAKKLNEKDYLYGVKYEMEEEE